MGVMLFWAIPRFHQVLAAEDTRKVARWLMVHAAEARWRALDEQVRFILHVGIDENRLWITNDAMSEEAALAAKQKRAFVLHRGVHIRKVHAPGKPAMLSGTAAIAFYPDGHADPVWIHLEDGAGPATLFVEPFLPKIRYFNAKAEASR